MNISGIDISKALSSFGLQNNSNLQKIASTITKGITDVFSQSDETTKFKNIVSQYDITNISKNDTKNLYKELYENKLISLKDMLLTLDVSKIPGLKDKSNSVSEAKTASTPDEKINLLEEFKKQADFNRQHGNSQFQNLFDERQKLAEKIYYFQS